MERRTPVRKPNTSNADLLSWSETPPPPPPDHSPASAARSHQPSDGISKVLGGGQITDEEAQSLNKLKNCSGYKLKEMNGSGIFAHDPKHASESDATTGLRHYQQTLNGVSQISFSADGTVSPKKPTTLTEVAKQRELSGNLLTEADLKSKKQISSAKMEEISGHNIFGPPTEIQPPRSLAAAQQEARRGSNRDMGEPAPRNLRTSVKVSNPAGGQSNILFSEEPEVKSSKKIHDQKFQELTGNGIFKGDESAGSGDKQLSSAKLREMSGNNIFGDGKAESRDYFGGVKKPPGGESSISLV
ncbi:Uncharacterized protein Rs2_12710 [Raphanus sativus]|uniref:Uncharacterized protein LOC108852187 n=1 Tax=Raphanus sativus TaxID=3726 RepID=A0A6J0N928_RAPSA|nr:uncharacterized protein LOC108852187 [Raphanus sativus]KAJ4898759.1 Uncharacterized protein Rs2_12710 [Raphanus sativus]